METKDEYGVYSDDGKTMLKVTVGGRLVVRPSVENLAVDEEGYSPLCRNQLSSIVFTEGCTRIGTGWDLHYFDVIDHDDYKLQDIYLSSTIREVDPHAFSNYSGICNVWVPKGMKEHFCGILPEYLARHVKTGYGDEQGAWYCTEEGLSLYLVPRDLEGEYVCAKGVTKICDYAFAGCKGLTKIVIGDSVTEIGAKAFKECENLAGIDLGNAVKKIGDAAFSGCSCMCGRRTASGTSTIASCGR